MSARSVELYFIMQVAPLARGGRLLVGIGLWVGLSITDTPEFAKAVKKDRSLSVPLAALFRHHKLNLLLGTFVALATFVLFYFATAWSLSYNIKTLQIPLKDALLIQMNGSIVFGLTSLFADKIADHGGRHGFLIVVTILTGAFTLSLGSLMQGSARNEASVSLFVTIGLMLLGLPDGVIGAAQVRYTGSSLTSNFAGIFGASLAPYSTTWLQMNDGMAEVGYSLLGAAVISMICVVTTGRDRI